MLPVIPHHGIKDVPKTVQVFQYDTSPAAGRLPLLIVPGRNDERYRYFHMHKICNYFAGDPRFQKRYKIFLFRYNTLAPVKTNEEQFKVALRELASQQGHPLTVIAPSIAGNIVRKAMDDPQVDQSVVKLIALGSPFHGSPLLTRDWMLHSLLMHRTAPIRVVRTFCFNLFFKRNSYLLQNYYWDNFDGQEPAIGLSEASTHVSGSVVPPDMPPTGASAAQRGGKVIAYSGYIENDLTRNGVSKKRLPVLSNVASFVGTTFPAFLGGQHPMLRYLNRQIAKVPVKDQVNGFYAFNDGIVPISSSLSLSSGGAVEPLVTDPGAIEQIKNRIGVKKARLFPNIDHVTFLYGTGPSGRNVDLPDKLSPNENPRPMFEWLLSDVLDSSEDQPDSGTLAESARQPMMLAAPAIQNRNPD